MIGTRYEEYGSFAGDLPFMLQPGIRRSMYTQSREQNWHEDPELQLCTGGEGRVIVDGESYPFKMGDFIMVGSGELHYTGTDESLEYTCLIISAGFCRQVGIDCGRLDFTPHFRDEELSSLTGRLTDVYLDRSDLLRTAKLYRILLDMLIHIAGKYSSERQKPDQPDSAIAAVKETIRYIREHFSEHFSLDELSRAVCTDKYALCREFRKFTGQTIVGCANRYRCQRAAEYIASGCGAAEAARLCGFENMSFFTRTFKKHMGSLPSELKQRRR